MVAQDSRSSDELDDTSVTFGQQNSKKESFIKVHCQSFFEQESSTEEEMSYSEAGRAANETTHATEHPGENIVCSEQSMWHDDTNEKSAFGGNLMKRIMAKK